MGFPGQPVAIIHDGPKGVKKRHLSAFTSYKGAVDTFVITFETAIQLRIDFPNMFLRTLT